MPRYATPRRAARSGHLNPNKHKEVKMNRVACQSSLSLSAFVRNHEAARRTIPGNILASIFLHHSPRLTDDHGSRACPGYTAPISDLLWRRKQQKESSRGAMTASSQDPTRREWASEKWIKAYNPHRYRTVHTQKSRLCLYSTPGEIDIQLNSQLCPSAHVGVRNVTSVTLTPANYNARSGGNRPKTTSDHHQSPDLGLSRP